MSNNPFSFEYGEEEKDEEKKPQPSVKKKVVKHHPIPIKKQVEDKTIPLPQEDTIVAPPAVETPTDQTATTPPVSVPLSESSTMVAIPPKEVDKPVLNTETAVVATIAVAATTAVVATGASALSKAGHLKKLRSKSKSPKQDHKSQDQQKREEKKKEEQTKCDAKSKEVQSLIDETNKEFESLESNFLKFVGLEEDKEFSESISSLKDELKKLKKAIKEFE